MFSPRAIKPSHFSNKEESHSATGTDYVNSFIFWSLIAYMSTLVFEGPLRYALSIMGLGTLIYLRDGLVVAVIVLKTIQAIRVRNNILDPLIISTYSLLFLSLLGLLIHDVSLFSALFGLKIFLVFLLGMSAANAIETNIKKFQKLIAVFVAATIIGVMVNYLLGKLPWEGLAFETSFGVSTTTKEWWTDGERRLPGFARASFDAAMIIGLGTTYLLTRLSLPTSVVLFSIAFGAIYLTTTKGMMLALGLVFVWRCTPGERSKILLGNIICIAILIGMVALPALSCSVNFSDRLMLEAPKVLSSFAERIVSMWPKSCEILATPYSWFIGAGVGSIGVPQQYSNLSNGYSAADNLFVYLYVIGGIPLSVAFFATILKLLRKPNVGSLPSTNIRALLISMLAYGVTTNMMEQPFFAILAGVLTYIAWTKTGERNITDVR